MYRFLATSRWVGLTALMIAASGVMVGLGVWQLHRYEERSAINARIDAAAVSQPLAVTAVLPAPDRSAGPGRAAGPAVGAAPPAAVAWTRVSATGVYDAAHEILARGRTVDGRVGYEVVTPLRLADGTAVLVDRGWVPVARTGGAAARPDIPPPPHGEVTVVGRVHLSESGGRPVEAGGQVRRIGVPQIAHELPYPVYGAYLLAESVPSGFVAVPVRHENAWQNAGYVVQWWLLAALVLAALVYLARREARGPTPAPAFFPRDPLPRDHEVSSSPLGVS